MTIVNSTPFDICLFAIHSDIIKQHQESGTQEETMSLPRNRLTPPRLLICYSSYDGPAHVKAVMQLGAFVQQHMATQVVGLTFHGPNDFSRF